MLRIFHLVKDIETRAQLLNGEYVMDCRYGSQQINGQHRFYLLIFT